MRFPAIFLLLTLSLALNSSCMHSPGANETFLMDKHLYQAVMESKVDDVASALRAGANPNSRTGYLSGTPLDFVRTARIAQMLLSAGAKPNL